MYECLGIHRRRIFQRSYLVIYFVNINKIGNFVNCIGLINNTLIKNYDHITFFILDGF